MRVSGESAAAAMYTGTAIAIAIGIATAVTVAVPVVRSPEVRVVVLERAPAFGTASTRGGVGKPIRP